MSGCFPSSAGRNIVRYEVLERGGVGASVLPDRFMHRLNVRVLNDGDDRDGLNCLAIWRGLR
jgi:hypothetical protein